MHRDKERFLRGLQTRPGAEIGSYLSLLLQPTKINDSPLGGPAQLHVLKHLIEVDIVQHVDQARTQNLTVSILNPHHPIGVGWPSDETEFHMRLQRGVRKEDRAWGQVKLRDQGTQLGAGYCSRHDAHRCIDRESSNRGSYSHDILPEPSPMDTGAGVNKDQQSLKLSAHF